jgi:pilus assembly protein CpaF
MKRIESARPGVAPGVPGGIPGPAEQRILGQIPVRESLREVKFRVQSRVIQDLDPKLDLANQIEVRRQIEEIFSRVVDEESLALTRAERLRMLEQITDEIIGLGPLEPLLRDDTVTEIMVNGPRQVYIERNGRLELTNVVFQNDDHVMRIIDRIIAPIGRRIDESSPMVDARLTDGSRVNAIIPPLSLVGPVVTVRKFSASPFTVDDLIRFGTATPEMFDFLRACVEARLNIFVSGGTGSGKTTTLNVLSSFIPNDERIITVEDAAELQLRQEHVVTLESRQPNIEGHGAVPIRELVRNCLRMRPDRIIVGECRGGEALDMLQAMNTGHDGSMSTGHANSPRDMLSRLETMVLMAGVDLPLRAIREQVSAAVDLIVHQSRLKDGSRRIQYITEVQGMEGDIIVMQDVFLFEQTGVIEGKIQGRLRATGIRPKFVEKFEVMGIHLPAGLFGFA